MICLYASPLRISITPVSLSNYYNGIKNEIWTSNLTSVTFKIKSKSNLTHILYFTCYDYCDKN